MALIKKAAEQDAAVLSAIGKRSLIELHGHSAAAEVMNEYVSNSFSLATCQEELGNPGHVYHIIYHNEQPAGYSKIIYNTPHPNVPVQQVTKLERLYLLQEFYSLKLGYELFQFNVDLSKKEGQAGMWLYVWKENHRAINFYTKNGFTIVGDGFFRLTDTHSNPNHVMFLAY